MVHYATIIFDVKHLKEFELLFISSFKHKIYIARKSAAYSSGFIKHLETNDDFS